MMLSEVSVIIPVYNAEKYLKKAVVSALNQPEVKEVILIEDNSPDNALMVCKALQDEFEKVKLYRHPNGENRGAGASRNLGIEKASCEYIAFLDADDWYLPNRFEKTKEVFRDKSIEGVYEPIGTFFNESEGVLFRKKWNKKEGEKIITFPKVRVAPENLFFYLLDPHSGAFSTLGVTLRKSLIRKVGKFSENLRLHQDMEYWVRCAYFGKMASPENPVPVAKRRVHNENRIAKRDFDSKALYTTNLVNHLRGLPISFKAKVMLYKRIIIYNTSRKYIRTVFNYPELFLLAVKYFFVFLFWTKSKHYER